MKAIVNISLKEGILDPQGKAVEHSLKSLGFDSVTGVRIGKFIEIEIDASEDSITETVDQMCVKLLSNPVTENYQISISKTGNDKKY